MYFYHDIYWNQYRKTWIQALKLEKEERLDWTFIPKLILMEIPTNLTSVSNQ